MSEWGPDVLDLHPQFQALPPDGITVFAGLPHTHKLGRSVRLRHLRNGVEMAVPFQDRFYDPNYQTMRRLEMRVMPKDHLMTECVYNTTGRESITRGGYSSNSEMCGSVASPARPKNFNP